MQPHFEIEIANQQDCLVVDEAFLTEVCRKLLAEEQVSEARISLALVDNAAIHEVNRTFLQHDYPTDVISFLLEQPVPAVSSGMPRGAGKAIDGELVISAEMACETAARLSWSPHDELVLYVVHGLLHLCGYDDQSDEERSLMRARERATLRHWNLSRCDSDADDSGQFRQADELPGVGN
jgi:probable rRNA maturation factor